MSNIKTEDVVNMFDEKIRELQIARRIFIEQFGNGAIKESVESPSLFKEVIPERKSRRTRFTKSLSARDTVMRLIKERGPLKAKEIHEITGIKRGTVGWLLGGNKDIFVSLGGGKWDLTEAYKTKSLTN